MVGAPDRICRFAVWNDFRIPRCEGKDFMVFPPLRLYFQLS